MGAGTRAAVRRRARAVPGCADRVRGPRRPPRRRGHRGRHAALSWRSRGGQGSVRIHPLSSCPAPAWEASERPDEAGAASTRGLPRSCCRDVCRARPRRRGEGLHRASGRLPGDRHAALRRLRRSPVLRLRSDRPRSEGPRLLRFPGGKEVSHVVRRGASTSPHLPRAQQAPLRRDWRAEQPQPQARYARPRHRTADGARCRAWRAQASSGWAPSARRSNTSAQQRRLRLKELPHLVFGAGPDKTIRYFPDKLPIGVTGDGRTHVFLYLVNRKAPVDFRAFLHRHVGAAASAARVGASASRAAPLAGGGAALRAGCARGVGPAASVRRRGRASLVSSGSKTKSITVARPRTSGGFVAPVALSGRRGFTCSIGSGRRTATGPWTPQCRRCSRTRSRARRGHVTSEVLPHLYAHLSPLVGSA